MAIAKKGLQKSTPIYTKQDFLDGKCTADGLPLNGGKVEPEPTPTPSPEPTPETTPVTEEVETQNPVGEEAPADGQELPEEPVQEEGGVNCDDSDGEESKNDTN